MTRRTTTLPAHLHEKYMGELEQLLDERDDLGSKTKAVRKLLRGELEIIDDSIARVRLRLKGVDGHQVEIPGTETGERRRSSEVMAILDAAARVGGVDAAEDARHDAKEVAEDLRYGSKKFPRASGSDEPCTACGRPYGEHAGQKCPQPKNGKLPLLDPEQLVGTREEAIERHEARHHEKAAAPEKRAPEKWNRGPNLPKKRKGKATTDGEESGG